MYLEPYQTFKIVSFAVSKLLNFFARHSMFDRVLNIPLDSVVVSKKRTGLLSNIYLDKHLSSYFFLDL